MTEIQKRLRCALLAALALVLSLLERLIPLEMIAPLPAVKLGLANIVMLVAMGCMDGACAWRILLLRCLLSVIFGANAASLLFSLCGGVLALTAMRLAQRLPWLSIYGVSVLGAAAHAIGQIVAAMALTHSAYIGAYLAYLLPVCACTGMATGRMAAGVLRAFQTAGNWGRKNETNRNPAAAFGAAERMCGADGGVRRGE